MSESIRVLFAAGGTGGHIFPALAVAQAMQSLAPAVQVSFVGTRHGLESRLVPRYGFAVDYVDVRFLKGTRLLKKLKHMALLPRSAWQCWRLLRRLRPQVVIGAGGYVSGPLVAMASLMGIPTAIMEQNAIAGLTNRLLGPLVRRVFVSFPGVSYPFKAKKIRALGNPVREMGDAVADRERRAEALHVLVFGGSQGAVPLNRQVPRALRALGEQGTKLVVRHQAGQGRQAETEEAYAGFAGQVEVSAFIDEMPGAYRWADLVICRAGATSLAELKAAGKAAILVPFPRAAHDHQTRNAEAMVAADAAWMLTDDDLAGDALVTLLQRLLGDPEEVRLRAAKALALAQPEAARDVARESLGMAGWKDPAAARDAAEKGVS